MFPKMIFGRNITNAVNFCKFHSITQRICVLSKPQGLPLALRCIRRTTTQAGHKVEWFSDVTPRARRIVGTWLLGCAGMCFGAVVIGGITRLTESGLSMTQWNLIKGMKPPRTDEEWRDEFERYKQFPEYQYIHNELTVEGFKNIFFWEYLHRMWGRGIGLFCLLPAIGFGMKGMITRPMVPRLGIYFLLVGCQGLLGWYMVKSGLSPKPEVTDVPRVSQYRLAAHLSSALVLYSLFLWSGLTHLITPQQYIRTAQIVKLHKFAHVTTALVFFTAVSGAFVAGLDAGLVYNTYPKFADRWIPTDLLSFSPKWKNITENPTTVQFNHRLMGELTGGAVLALYVMALRAPLPPRAKMAAHCLAAMAFVQVTLGIFTLLSHVHIHAAATHQAGSVTLLSCALWLMHELRRLPK